MIAVLLLTVLSANTSLPTTPEEFLGRYNQGTLPPVRAGRLFFEDQFGSGTDCDPRWSVDFSPPEEPKMVGAVSERFTFYVSASRFAGANRLAQVGDSYVVPEELVAHDFRVRQRARNGSRGACGANGRSFW